MGPVLVFQLDADHRPAVFPQEPIKLLGDFPVEAADVIEIHRIVAPHLALGEDPVGKPAVAAFPVRPRAAADEREKAPAADELDEPAQVSLAGPIKLPLDLFVVDPKDVGRDDLDAARLHLEQFVVPIFLGIPAEVKLAHDAEPWPVVQQ